VFSECEKDASEEYFKTVLKPEVPSSLGPQSCLEEKEEEEVGGGE